MRRAAIFAFGAAAVAACGGAGASGPGRPVGPSAGSASGSADGSGSGSGGAVVVGVTTNAAPGCLPASTADHPLALDLARVGDAWIACAVDRAAKDAEARCWAVDVATGALAPRALEAHALPGYAHRDVDGALVIGEPGRDPRLVRIDATTIKLGATDRPLHDAKAKDAMPASVSPAWAWLAGDTIYVLGDDGALYLYPDGKPPQHALHGLRSGGAGVSGGTIAVHEGALTRITVMDGVTRRTTHGRAKHDEVCRPDDAYAPGHEPDAREACGAHLAEHYRPYLATTIVADGDRFVGVDARGAVFVLDAQLAETSRAPLAICK